MSTIETLIRNQSFIQIYNYVTKDLKILSQNDI